MATRHRKRIVPAGKDIKSEAPAPEVAKKEKELDQHNISTPLHVDQHTISTPLHAGGAAPEVAKKEKELDQHNISSEKEAMALVKRDYKTPLHVEYTVLQNGNVFYGNNRNVALSYARKFNLKYFDVKF